MPDVVHIYNVRRISRRESRARRSFLRRNQRPPTAREARELPVSPVARRSIDEILATQNQRSQFHRRLGGAIERGLQIANDEAPASGRSPGNIFALGPGLDYGASRRNFSQLTQFLFRVSLEDDSLRRRAALMPVIRHLEANEDLLVDLQRNPRRYGVDSPHDLVAIIVRQAWASMLLGRRVPVEASAVSTETADEQLAAYRATGVRIPQVVLAHTRLLRDLIDQIGCVTRARLAEIDAASRG